MEWVGESKDLNLVDEDRAGTFSPTHSHNKQSLDGQRMCYGTPIQILRNK